MGKKGEKKGKEKEKGNGKGKGKKRKVTKSGIFRLVPKYMYVYTHLGLWLDWLLLLLLGSFTSRLHFLPSPSLSLSLYLDQYFTYIRVSKEKNYLLLVLWAWGLV